MLRTEPPAEAREAIGLSLQVTDSDDEEIDGYGYSATVTKATSAPSPSPKTLSNLLGVEGLDLEVECVDELRTW